jgi:hypothetical protein
MFFGYSLIIVIFYYISIENLIINTTILAQKIPLVYVRI